MDKVKVWENKNSKCTDHSCSIAKLTKNQLGLKCTPFTQSILCLIFLMYVRTI